MKPVIKISSLLIVLCLLAFSASAVHAAVESGAVKGEAKLKSQNESWYTYWALGYPAISYDGKMKDLAGSFKTGRSSYNFDILGFYWPVNRHRTMVGFIANLSFDDLSRGDAKLEINHYLFGPSAMHFFGSNIGHGFFLRTDVGMSRYYLTLSEPGKPDRFNGSSYGIGVLVGGGYALPVAEGTRLMFSVNGAYRSAFQKITDETLRTYSLNFTTGFLF